MSGKEELPRARERRAGRWLRALLGAFSGLTFGWIVSVFMVPGDLFQFGPGSIICIGLAGSLGAYAGFRVRVRWKQALMAVGVGLSVVYWALAPSGWWAKRPLPMRGSIAVPR